MRLTGKIAALTADNWKKATITAFKGQHSVV